jgi:periplasmic protein TonB
MHSNALLHAAARAPTGFARGSRVVLIHADDPGPPGRGCYRQPAACRTFGSVGTFCLFAAAIGIMLWISHSPIAHVVPAAPLAVTFELAPAPSAPPAPPVDLPAGPARQAQEAARAVEAKAEARPVDIVLPDVPSLPSTAAPAEQPSSDSRPVERTTAPPAMSNPGMTAAARLPSASMERAALANWQSQLLGHLKGYLRFPRQAERSRQEGVALISVTVDRQGRVLNARIDRGSGYPLLDGEAVATVRRGSPVPAPTADIRGDPVTVTIPIQFALRR